MPSDLAPAVSPPGAPFLAWANPGADEKKPTLVRLTPSALTLAVVPPADLDRALDGLRRGEDLPGQAIPLSCVTRADGDDDGAALTVHYRVGPSKIEKADMSFDKPESRGEFLTALAGALGPGWENGKQAVSRWSVGLWVLLPTVILALITWGLYAEASLIAEGKPPVNWGRGGRLRVLAEVTHWLEARLGPTGVLLSGGSLVACGVALFLLVMASPPIQVVVRQRHGASP